MLRVYVHAGTNAEALVVVSTVAAHAAAISVPIPVPKRRETPAVVPQVPEPDLELYSLWST